MTVKLLDKETKSLVDFEPNAVNSLIPRAQSVRLALP